MLWAPRSSGVGAAAAKALVMLPPAVLQTAASLLVPRLAGRLPHWKLVSAGPVMASIGLLLMPPVPHPPHIPLLIAGMTIMGIGVMPMMILGTDMVVSAAPARKAGAASATSETATELGMALGIAVIGSIGAALYRNHMLTAMPKGLSDTLALAAGDTLGGAIGAAAQLPDDIAQPLMAAAKTGFNLALHANAAIGAVILALTAMGVVVMLRRIPNDENDSAQELTPLAISPDQE